MPKESDNENFASDFFADLPAEPTVPAGFSHEQMVRCEECLRANAPTRVNCLYCGHALPVTEASAALAKPSLRPLEAWEQGYNTILLRRPNAEPTDEVLNQIAGLLQLDLSAITRALAANCALPLARSATQEDAALIERRLNQLGLETITVPDLELQLESSPPLRLRRMELSDDEIIVYQVLSAAGVPIEWAEINLLVMGRLFVKQVELRERKRRRPENEITYSSEIASDEAVVDIYSGKRAESWRISAANFDFSCLGESKTLLAGENFPRLVKLLCERAPNAELNDSYQALRHYLELVWPAPKRTESGGLKLRGSKYSTAEIITANSEPQFTRYSRLCHYLKRNSLI